MSFYLRLLKLLPMFKKHWKVAAAGVAILIAFAAGWKTSSGRWEEKILAENLARNEAIQEMLFERETELRSEYDQLLASSEDIALGFQMELEALHSTHRNLQSEVDTVSLTKPPEACEWTIDEEPKLQNPFSSEFVRIWNDAARRGLPNN